MAYFTWHNALKVNPCHSMCQNFLPFWGRETFHCVNTPYFFFFQAIHLMCIWVVFIFWLLYIMLLWTWVYTYFLEMLLSILWGVYLELELLNHMVVLFLTFEEPLYCFKIAIPLYIPTNRAQKSQFLHILTNTYFLIAVMLMGENWYFIVVLIAFLY